MAVCNDYICSNPTQITVDDTNPTGWFGVGKYSSLALNNFGYPVISYYDDHNANLKLTTYDITLAPGNIAVAFPAPDNLIVNWPGGAPTMCGRTHHPISIRVRAPAR